MNYDPTSISKNEADTNYLTLVTFVNLEDLYDKFTNSFQIYMTWIAAFFEIQKEKKMQPKDLRLLINT